MTPKKPLRHSARTHYFTLAESLGGRILDFASRFNDSWVYPQRGSRSGGLKDSLIRISVGIEDVKT